ncbi:MAG TPA: TolC family protein [Polyangia bacterium]|nr:TolC family protein [Polyangia bacterium]
MKRWLALATGALALTLTATAARADADAYQTLPAELSLDKALQIGRMLQPQRREAQAQVDAAHARVDEAVSNLLPQVNANASYSRATLNPTPQMNGSTSNFIPPAPSWNTFNFWRSGLSATQLIYDFGQTWQKQKASRASAEQQEDSERFTQLTSDLAIRAAFYTARAARDAVGVARETLANQNKHVEQIQAFTEVGTRPEVDLLQARTDQANAEVTLINAQNDYATARALLNQAMGVEAPATYEVTGEASPPLTGEEAPLETLVDEALRARPDVAAKIAALRAQDLNNKATEGRYGPTLNAVTGLTYNGPELGNLVWNWSGGFTLSWALFEGGNVRASVREGNALSAAARAEVDIARQQARVEVDQARLTIIAGKAAIAAAERSLANAKARLDLAEVRYRTGVGNGIELSDAQLAATNAGFQRLQALLKLDTARAQLQKALGRP